MIMISSRKVLITGGAGYIGHHVVNLLKDRSIVYDSLLYTNEYFEEVEFVRGDVTDYPLLKRYLDQVERVIWLAAIVGDAASMVNPTKAIATNQEAVRFLAQNFEGPIIFTSSCSTYGFSEQVATETSPLAPQSLYAETKIRAEEYLAGSNALILRLGTLHGVSKRMRFDLAVNVLTMKAVLNKRIQVFGGKQYRPLLSVKDAAEFIVAMVDYRWEPGIYNLASENLCILEVAEIVRARLPETQVEVVESQFEDRRNYRVDCSKAEKLLGFTGKRRVGDSVSEITDLVRSGRIKDLSDVRFTNLSALKLISSEER
jgi:nucleoside-diphosphate-sugar epimerase